ncbi:MAG: hypothetical protein N3C60_04840 [Calditerrivibrio sp.]|nr:hypothetical protein [Calditerrivibrio sp.]
MDRVILLYMIERPIFSVSFIISSVPLWFAIVYPIEKSLDIVFGILFILLVLLSKIYIQAEPTGVNPFLLLFNTIIRSAINVSLQISLLFVIVILMVFWLIEDITVVAIFSFIGVALIFSIIVFGRSNNLQMILGFRTVRDSRRNLLMGLFYNLLWIVILFTDDSLLIVMGVVIAIYFHYKDFSKEMESIV